MATATFAGFLQRLRMETGVGALAPCSDRELIKRFLASHDEAAFQALLQRHGPMVLRVCRRALPDEQDVEDAFQATFLILAREARRIRKQASLASWLHGVANRVALDARADGARRRKHESQAVVTRSARELTDEISWKELRSVLDDELVKLPERLRAPLVLCYLEGLTQDEAALQLGQSKSTCRRNLERAREVLGSRLARRGVTLSAGLFSLLLSECATGAPVPLSLASATLKAAIVSAAGKAALAASVSSKVAVLVHGGIHAMFLAKLKYAVATTMIAGLLVVGAAVFTRPAAQAQSQGQESSPVNAVELPAPTEQQPSRKELTKLEKKLVGTWVGARGLVVPTLTISAAGTFRKTILQETIEGSWAFEADELPAVLIMRVSKSNDKATPPDTVLRNKIVALDDKRLAFENPNYEPRPINYFRVKEAPPADREKPEPKGGGGQPDAAMTK